MADRKIKYVLDVDPKSGVASVKKFTGDFKDGMGRAEKSALSLKNVIAAIGVGYLAKQTLDFGRTAADEFARVESAAFGLKRATGDMFADLNARAEKFNAATKNQFGLPAIQQAITSNYKSMERFGLGAEQVFEIVQRGADQAAIKNRDLEETSQALFNAIRGEAEAAESLGVTLNDTYMKSIAFNGSLADQWEKLTDAEKAQYRYKEILNQTSHTVGSAADSFENLSGKQRATDQRMRDMYATVGEDLAPELKEMYGLLIEKGIPALEKLASTVGGPVVQTFSFWIEKLGVAMDYWADFLETTNAERIAEINSEIAATKKALEDLKTGEGWAAMTPPEFRAERMKDLRVALKLLESELVQLSKKTTDAHKDEAAAATESAAIVTTGEEDKQGAIDKTSDAYKTQLAILESFASDGERWMDEFYDEYVASAEKGEKDATEATEEEIKTRQKLFKEYLVSIRKGHGTVIDAMATGWASATLEMEGTNELLLDGSINTFDTMRGKIVEFIAEGTGSFEEFGQAIVDVWRRTAAEIAATQIMGVIGISPTANSGSLGFDFSSFASSAGSFFTGSSGAADTALMGFENAGLLESAPSLGDKALSLGKAHPYLAAIAAAELGRNIGGGANERGVSGILSGAAAGGFLGGPLGAAAGGAYGLFRGLTSGGMFSGPPDRAPQTVYGVKDAHKDPNAALMGVIGKFSEHSASGDSEGAGFVLQQFDDINDRLPVTTELSGDLLDRWNELTGQSYEAGRAVQEYGLESDQARGALGDLSQGATALAEDLIASGHSTDVATQAALALAAATNTAAAEASAEMTAMGQLSEQLWQTSEATWGLSQAAEGARLAQDMLRNASGLTYDQYIALQSATTELNAIDKEQRDIIQKLGDDVPETEAEYKKFQERLEWLNTRATELITGVDGLGVAINNLPDGKKIDIDVNWPDDPGKHHSGYNLDMSSTGPGEHMALIRDDESVVPPERRVDFARRVLAAEPPSVVGGDGGSITQHVSLTLNAPLHLDGREVARAVIPVQLELSRQGVTVVDSRGVGAGIR